jgi:hypothetical protein
VAESVKPGHIVCVADFSSDTIRGLIAHLEVSTDFEHLVFREAELDAICSLIDFALSDRPAPAQVLAMSQLREAANRAYLLVGRKRPREAGHQLRSFAA